LQSLPSLKADASRETAVVAVAFPKSAESDRAGGGNMPKSKLTGPDYLMAVADQVKELPFAEEFRDMIWDCFSGPAVTVGMNVAQRPLTPTEQAPVVIVAAAAEAAREQRDWKSLDEILNVGLSLAVKFPEFLETKS
jgi:hypothetical protein